MKFYQIQNQKLLEINRYEKIKKELNHESKKIIIRNDVKKKRQQLNFSIDTGLHLDIKELHLREQKKRQARFNLADFLEEIIARGVREWRNL